MIICKGCGEEYLGCNGHLPPDKCPNCGLKTEVDIDGGGHPYPITWWIHPKKEESK